MNEQLASEVFKRLDILGNQLSVAGIKLGEEAIKWTMYRNIADFFVELFWVIVPFIVGKKVIQLLVQAFKDDDDAAKFTLSMSLFALSIPFFIAICCMPETFANIFSPTWAIVRSFIPSNVGH